MEYPDDSQPKKPRGVMRRCYDPQTTASARDDVQRGRIDMGFWNWHRRQTELWQQRLGMDDYQLLWFGFLKGLFLGILLTLWLA